MIPIKRFVLPIAVGDFNCDRVILYHQTDWQRLAGKIRHFKIYSTDSPLQNTVHINTSDVNKYISFKYLVHFFQQLLYNICCSPSQKHYNLLVLHLFPTFWKQMSLKMVTLFLSAVFPSSPSFILKLRQHWLFYFLMRADCVCTGSAFCFTAGCMQPKCFTASGSTQLFDLLQNGSVFLSQITWKQSVADFSHKQCPIRDGGCILLQKLLTRRCRKCPPCCIWLLLNPMSVLWPLYCLYVLSPVALTTAL